MAILPRIDPPPGAATPPSMPWTSPENTASALRISFSRGNIAQVQACASEAPGPPTSKRFATRATATNAALVLACPEYTRIRLRGPPSASVHQLAAVDLYDLAYQVVGRRRGKEDHSPCHLPGGPLAPDWDAGRHALANLGRRETLVEGRGDDAGGHAVDQDVLRDELLGHRAGKGADAPLGGRVGRGAGPAAVAGRDGGHVDYATLALPLHRRQDRLRAEEDRLQVHLHDAVPEVLGHLREAAAFDQGPRVVHQDVEAAVAVLDLARHPPDLPCVRHVAPDEHRLAARRRDPLHNLARLILAAVVVDRYPAARFGERHRRGGPDPRAAARHPSDLFRKHHPTVTPL